jgi:hypothetical protein
VCLCARTSAGRWGSLTLLLVKHYGARVTGITLSEQQLALATERVKAAGARCVCVSECVCVGGGYLWV